VAQTAIGHYNFFTTYDLTDNVGLGDEQVRVAATNITGDMIAGAISEGDDRYRDLADHFGRPPLSESSARSVLKQPTATTYSRII
jgi:hypothetical protein